MTRPARMLVVAVSPCVDRYAWFDRFELGIPNRPKRVEARPGGKAMNAARVLRTLGASVTVVAPLDRSDWAWWTDRSAREGIVISPSIVEGTCRMTFTCIDEGAARATEMYEPSTPLTSDEWDRLAGHACALVAGDPPAAVLLAGSRPGDDGGALARIVGCARSAGVPTYLDGYGPPVRGAIEAGPTVLKVNLEEARRLLDDAALGAEDAAEGLRGLGPRIAVVTLGVDGAIASDGTGIFRVPPPAEPAAFPGGSGDAFLAGLAEAHATGRGLAAALEQARSCAEENARSPFAGSVVPDAVPSER